MKCKATTSAILEGWGNRHDLCLNFSLLILWNIDRWPCYRNIYSSWENSEADDQTFSNEVSGAGRKYSNDHISRMAAGDGYRRTMGSVQVVIR